MKNHSSTYQSRRHIEVAVRNDLVHREILTGAFFFQLRTERISNGSQGLLKISTHPRPAVDFDSFRGDHTRVSDSRPTCPDDMHPILHDSLRAGKLLAQLDHPVEDKPPARENESASGAEGGDKQRQTKTTCLEEETERERRDKVTVRLIRA